MGPVAPRHVGSSQTRARTRVPCISRQILNHCATREAKPPILSTYFLPSLYCNWILHIWKHPCKMLLESQVAPQQRYMLLVTTLHRWTVCQVYWAQPCPLIFKAKKIPGMGTMALSVATTTSQNQSQRWQIKVPWLRCGWNLPCPCCFAFGVFWSRRTACGILVPRPGIEPGALAVRALSPNHWTARQLPCCFALMSVTIL